ncbi:MAG: TIGR04211 family SH3 domain-containing protein [Pseudomonadota bacterium]|nr:TIGR04211 family SH3 domain-containing protein [Pseudomonadota bacterium]
MKRLLLFLFGLCGTVQALAETGYVTDQFQITLRLGESTKHKIVRMLPSGAAVEILSSNPSSSYSKVRADDDSVGYVLTRQLLAEPVARDRLAAMETRLKELQQAPDQLTARLTKIQSEHETLRADHEDLEREKDQLEQELATIRHASANVVQITQERSELRRRVADLTRQVADLQQENRDLNNQTTQRWFLIGAGVVAGGILIGLLLPHLRFQRRKSSWGSL